MACNSQLLFLYISSDNQIWSKDFINERSEMTCIFAGSNFIYSNDEVAHDGENLPNFTI